MKRDDGGEGGGTPGSGILQLSTLLLLWLFLHLFSEAAKSQMEAEVLLPQCLLFRSTKFPVNSWSRKVYAGSVSLQAPV